MKKVFEKVSLLLCLVLVLASCNSAGVRSYHRISSDGEAKLATPYLHGNIGSIYKDLGISETIKELNSGDEMDFDFPKKFLLSYHPTNGYILELEQKDSESRFFILGNHDFTIKIQNRNSGFIKMETSTKILQLSKTKQHIDGYTSCAAYIQRSEISYYLPEAIIEMTLEKSGSSLSMCWQDSFQQKIVYHAGFPKDNFVIESGGDLLSTNISYEQEYRFEYSKREGYYSSWKQEDIVFRGYFYENNQIKEYGFWNKAPQLEQ